MSTRKTATARANEIPNYDSYKDEGCEASPSCLTCPLPQCRYDNPIWFQQYKRLARDFRIWKTIQSESLTANKAAERFSVTARTISRIIQRCREAEKVQSVLHSRKNRVIAKSNRTGGTNHAGAQST